MAAQTFRHYTCQKCGGNHETGDVSMQKTCELICQAIERIRQTAEAGQVLIFQDRDGYDVFYPIANIIDHDFDNENCNASFYITNADKGYAFARPLETPAMWRARDEITAKLWLTMEIVSITEAVKRGWRVFSSYYWQEAPDKMQQEYYQAIKTIEVDNMSQVQKEILYISSTQSAPAPSIITSNFLDDFLMNMK